MLSSLTGTRHTSVVASCLAAMLRLVGEMEDNRFKHHRLWVGDLALAVDDDAAGAAVDDSKWAHSDTGGERPSSLRWRDVTQAIHVGKPLHQMHSAASQKLAMLYTLSSETLSKGGLPSLHDHSTGRGSRSISASGSGVNGSTYGGFKSGRSFSSFGYNSISAHNLTQALRGASAEGASGENQAEDMMTECSESSHDGMSVALSAKGSGSDTHKPLRGHIGVPKIAPFVGSLVAKRRKRSSTPASTVRPGINSAIAEPRTPLGGNTVSDTMSTTSGLTSDIDVKSVASVSPLPPPPPSKGNAVTAVLAAADFKGTDPSKRLGVPLDLQKQSLHSLNQVCEELPPASSLLLEGLPYLLRTRPLPDLEENTPRPLKVVSLGTEVEGQDVVAATSGAASALFYDPFEAKRARDRNRSSATTILWCQGEVARIEAIFCNPLGVPLPLYDIHVVVGGVCHKSYPIKSVIVPPDTEEFSVTLSICPLSVGKLTIQGVRYSIFNATHTSMVNPDTGVGIHDWPSEIARPWTYPRRPAAAATSRLPSTPRKGGVKQSQHVTNNVDAAKGKGVMGGVVNRIDISVVPETSELALWTSWGSRVEPPPLLAAEPASSQCAGHSRGNPTEVHSARMTNCVCRAFGNRSSLHLFV